MPAKKQQTKKKRVPHANETPLKHIQPGHGAVERAKNQMWSNSGPSSAAQQTSTGSNVARPKYKATATSTVGIGQRGVIAKKKKAVTPSVHKNEISK